MNQTKTAPILWDRVALVALVLIGIGLVVWWLESRFGSSVALMSVGIAVGVGVYMYGNVTGRRDAVDVAKATMSATADVLHEASRALELKAKAEGQIANRENGYIIQQERDAARYVNRLAQQQARVLTAPARAEPEPPVWARNADPDTDQPRGFTVYQ